MLRPGQGDYAEGQQLLRQGLELRRARGDQLGMAYSLLHLGILAQFQDDHAEGYRLMREALVLARRTGDPTFVVRILGFASGAACEIGAYDEAQHLADECIMMSHRMGDGFAMGLALNALGRVSHVQGQYLEARSRFQESLALFKELGDRWIIARTLSHLGQTLHCLGATPEAYQTFVAAFEMSMEAKAHPSALDAVIGLAALLREQGEPELAAELCLHMLRHPAASRRTTDHARQLWSDLKTTLPTERLIALEARARATPFEAVVAELVRDNRE